MGRWVRSQTNLHKHFICSGEKANHYSAWMWLISNAAWNDTTHRVNFKPVDVPRGSLFTTIRTLQNEWKWGSGKVNNFLQMLADQRMIKISTGTGKTHILINNYNKFQDFEKQTGTQTDTRTDTQTEHERNTKGNKLYQSKKVSKKELLSLSGESDDPKPTNGKKKFSEEFEAFWLEALTTPNMSKKSAYGQWQRLDAQSRIDARAALPGFKEYMATAEHTPLHVERYLSRRTFDGYCKQSAVISFEEQQRIIRELSSGGQKHAG